MTIPVGVRHRFGRDLATANVHGDGVPDLLVGRGVQSGAATTAAELFLDVGPHGGEPDGALSYAFRTAPQWLSVTVASASDVDGDGRDEILIGLPGRNEAYLINAADLILLDRDDGRGDGIVDLERISGRQRR